MALHDSSVGSNQNQQTSNESFQEQLTKRAQQRSFDANQVVNSNQQQAGTNSGTKASATPRFNPFDGRIFATPISRNRGSNSIKALMDRLTEICESAEDWITINILPLDKEGRSLAFGGVIVVGRDSTNPQETAFFHTFILEATGEALRPRNFTASTYTGNIDYEVVFTTPQAWDSEYVAVASELVLQRLGVKNAYQVDATVIPRNFSLDNDEESKEAVYNLAVNALAAIGNEILMSKPNWKDFSIKEFTSGNQYSININFNNPNATYDIVGNPIKNDITMEYCVSRKFQQQTNNGYVSLNKTENEAKGGTITGYMDLVWSYEGNGFGMINNNGMFGGNVNVPYIYTPNFVITSLKPDSILTPSSVLFALVNAMAIDRDSIWKQYFKPTDKVGHDLRDIGCIGYELIPHLAQFNQSVDEKLLQNGSYIDFKSDKVPIETVYTMLNLAMNNRIFVSLDIPEASPDTWMLSMFYHASEGKESARNAIISAADDLTEGRFSSNFPSNAPIFYNRGNRVHTGYYLDSDGNKEDIRDITYLAVLGMSKGDLNEIRNYSDTYNRTDYDISLRLSARKKIISRCTGDNCVITGYANRVTFSNEFLAALTKACSDAGYFPRLQTTLSPINVGNYRATPGYLNGVLLNQNYLNTSFGGYGQQQNIGGQYYQPQPTRHF